MVKTSSRRSQALLFIFTLFCLFVPAKALRVRLAIEDPHMALALEAVGEGSTLSWLRGRTFLLLGADPDAPILYWGMNEQPLVACVESGNDQLAEALVGESSLVTWQAAVRRACAEDRKRNEAIFRVLASRDGIDPGQLCAISEKF